MKTIEAEERNGPKTKHSKETNFCAYICIYDLAAQVRTHLKLEAFNFKYASDLIRAHILLCTLNSYNGNLLQCAE